MLSSLTVYEAYLILVVDPLLLMYFFQGENEAKNFPRRRFIGHSSHSSNIKSFYSGKQAVAKKTLHRFYDSLLFASAAAIAVVAVVIDGTIIMAQLFVVSGLI